jgi:hypothetical protein
MIEKKSTAAEPHRNARQAARSSQAMRSTFMTFAMLAYLIALWWVVHWVARLIVTEFGVLVGIGAIGVCIVTAVIMDRHGL